MAVQCSWNLGVNAYRTYRASKVFWDSQVPLVAAFIFIIIAVVIIVILMIIITIIIITVTIITTIIIMV